VAILIHYFNYMGLQLISNPISTEIPLSFQNCHHLGHLETVGGIFFHLYISEQLRECQQRGSRVDCRQETGCSQKTTVPGVWMAACMLGILFWRRTKVEDLGPMAPGRTSFLGQ